ncbi:phosphotransferase [Microlunatus soli]|uniref:Phosphotransferase enzyme family protein n=1 Tax=Microlunatus soli TaxID=630515 RepID=A0A1H1YQ09_9ACTN|nr:phosphotransferase [Microlunatus soli]SDT23440.1 Phosphotransferase enzyme family protein [Microlunatus soli]
MSIDQTSSAQSTLPASYAAGVRIPYAQLPAEVRDWVADQLPGPVSEIIDRRGGFSPGVAATVQTASGDGLFVKAVTAAINADSLRIYRNERDRGLRLPRLPGILKPTGAKEFGVHDRTGTEQAWIAITFPLLDGTPPAHPWSRADAVRCLDLCLRLSQQLTPAPWTDEPGATETMVDMFGGWQRLADADDDPWLDDPWITERLDELIMVEQELQAALPGDTLCHFDLRADNIMITSSGEPWFVDWAHARRAVGWLDPVFLVTDMIASGADRGDGGELDIVELLATHPACAAAPERLRFGLIGSWAVFLHSASRRPASPGLPTIRTWQQLSADAMLRFVRRVGTG